MTNQSRPGTPSQESEILMSVSLVIEDDVAQLQLGRPDAGNAFDLPAALSLRDAAQTLASAPDVRVVLLTARGPLFCAGGDVRAMAAAPDREKFIFELASVLHEALVTLRALPVPIVAAVQGTAAGAGIGLVLAADLVLASEKAKFVNAYARIGLSPDCGVSALLAGAVGPRRAALFALTDITLDAATAVEWGLISESCAPDVLDDRVNEVVAQLTGNATNCAGEAARLLRLATERTYAAQLDDEAATISRLAQTDEAGALIAAFGS